MQLTELIIDMDNVEGIKASTCGAFFAFKPPSVLIPKDLAPVWNLILIFVYFAIRFLENLLIHFTMNYLDGKWKC